MISYLEPVAQDYLSGFRSGYFSRDTPFRYKQSVVSTITLPLDEVRFSRAAQRIVDQTERLRKMQLGNME
jgi:hypothetical protein